MKQAQIGGKEKEELMETTETEKKRKLRPSDDAMFLRKAIINAIKRSDEQMESYSKKTDEKMDNFLQSVGTQLRGMNSTFEKMKEEGEDRYKQIDERIANMEKKFSMSDEKSEKN